MSSGLSAHDLRRAFDALDALADAGGGLDGFVRTGVRLLPRVVASELTLVSTCDLGAGRRVVHGAPSSAIGAEELDAFERHLVAHPLVLAHRCSPRAATGRIADAIGARAFRRSALYAEYYRPLGVDQAMAVPLRVDRRRVTSLVVHRRGRAFDDGERALLERMRPQLAALWRLGLATDGVRGPLAPRAAALTRREREILAWLRAGKTNRDIATIVGASPRTVEKHLEHVYVKLGVETRVAAAMRTLREPAAPR